MEKSKVVELLNISDKMVMKGLIMMLQRQDASEQQSGVTILQNGKGFNGVDAPFLTSLAMQAQTRGSLSPKQMESARKALKKYAGQIGDDIAKGVVINLPEIANNEAKQAIVKEEVIDEEISYKKINTKGQIELKLKHNDYIGRAQAKALKFTWNPKSSTWTAPDNAINRMFIGMDLPCGIIPEINFDKFPMLREYQKEDVEFMTAMGSCLNANEMGLGKTLEAIVYLDTMDSNRTLIVCPKSLIGNWETELIKWGVATEGEITKIEGNAKQKAKAVATMGKYVITNYDSIRSKEGKKKEEQNEILASLLEVEWDVIIADEAHRIKNKDSQQAKALDKLKLVSKNRLALTGTPVQNRPNDLWNPLHWINDFYSSKSYWRFVETFCELEDNGYGVKVVGLTKVEQHQRLLREMLQYTMVRHEKRDVLKDLPDKSYQSIDVQMTAKQAKLYETIKKEILFELASSGKEMMISNALTRLLRLQQVTSSPELFELDENPKFDVAMDLLEDSENKIVFFSRFETCIASFEKRLQKAGIKYVKITGDVKEGRTEIVKQFQEDDSIRVFIGTIKAAGEGLTLTSASSVVFFDREWSPAMNLQAEDRLHRIGQKNAVQVIDLKVPKTIDTWVEEVLGKKISDIEKIIE